MHVYSVQICSLVYMQVLMGVDWFNFALPAHTAKSANSAMPSFCTSWSGQPNEINEPHHLLPPDQLGSPPRASTNGRICSNWSIALPGAGSVLAIFEQISMCSDLLEFAMLEHSQMK